MKLFKNNPYLFVFSLFVFVFFAPFFINGKIPISADALVGLYHPFRDQLSEQFPNGYPFKNALITDPFRQQYPYRIAAMNALKKGELPKWNPYSFSGTPLFANIQTAALYPLNLLFWIFSDSTAWSLLIVLQPLLAGLFTYAYLQHLKLDGRAAFLGSLSYAFSGFMIAWLEWNTIGHVALWLPLILLAKDHLLEKCTVPWATVLIFAESALLLAGHLQTAFYIILFTTIHLVACSWWKSERSLTKTLKKLLPFGITATTVLFITSIQLIPAIRLIFLSSRNADLSSWQRADWFLPVMHLLQFLAPDFFGNPATGNYWGIWNYGEFVGYIGLLPFILALVAVFFRRDLKTSCFTAALLICLLLALPTPLAKIPYQLQIPFLSTLQPSRMLILICFSSSVLAALGFDYVLHNPKQRKQNWWLIVQSMGLMFIAIWVVFLFKNQLNVGFELSGYLDVARRNLIVPTLLLSAGAGLFWGLKRVQSKKFVKYLAIGILVVTAVDMYRFGHKFTPFTDKNLLFPKTKVITFLKENLGEYRFMTTDRRIMPPNVSVFYQLQSVDGYDPLYLRRYSELISAWTRDRADITPGAFNRILTPENPNSFLSDLMGVKYVLSLQDETNPKLKLVFQEGETRVYENMQVLPRAFLVAGVSGNLPTKEIVDQLFADANQLLQKAFIPTSVELPAQPLSLSEKATVTNYQENHITIKTTTAVKRLLVLTDLYYPDWQVFVDQQKTEMIPADYFFRGVIVPEGEHTVEFKI